MDDDAPKPLTDLLEPGSTLMVGTKPADDWEFRPLTVARVDGSRIEILLDTDEDWVRAFNDGDRVSTTMSDNRTNTWVALTGTATTTSDPAVIDELWNPFAAAYFDQGRETPGIAVMRIDAEEGRYWSTPSGRIGALVSMVKAKLGNAEQSGEHGDIAVS